MEGYAGIYAWCEWVKLNICNISIFKTPVGLGLWLSEGSSEQIPESSRCPWLSGFTESGGCWTSLSTVPVSLSPIYFGKASTASSSVTQQEQELDSSLASVSVIFCCVPPLSFFFPISGKYQQWKKQKLSLHFSMPSIFHKLCRITWGRSVVWYLP